MLTRVNHVALGVHDLEGALRFYRDTLGLPATPVNGGVELPVGRSAVRIAVVADDQPEGVVAVAFDDDGLASGDRGVHEDADANLSLGIVRMPAVAIPDAPTDGHVRFLDHIVVASNDSAATAAHFRDRLGMEIKRTMTRPGTGAHLEFAKLVDVTIEFAGPPQPRPGELKARFWGVVFAVDDIDAVVADARAAGYPVSDPIPAVQPGAKIATVKAGTGGVPFALIQYNAL